MKKFEVEATITDVRKVTIEVDAEDEKAARQVVLDNEYEEDDITDDEFQETIDTKIHSVEEVE